MEKTILDFHFDYLNPSLRQVCFGLVSLVWQVWLDRFGQIGLDWFGRFGLVGLVWQVGLVGLVGTHLVRLPYTEPQLLPQQLLLNLQHCAWQKVENCKYFSLEKGGKGALIGWSTPSSPLKMCHTRHICHHKLYCTSKTSYKSATMHFANEGEGSSVVKDYKHIIQKSKNENKFFGIRKGKGALLA